MTIALFIRNIEADAEPSLHFLERLLTERGIAWCCYDDSQSLAGVDFILSIGGDGTLLSAARLAAERHIAVAGVNFGHLGFLTTAGKEDVETLVDDLVEGRFSIEERSLLAVEMSGHQPFPPALNEVSIQRKEYRSFLKVDVFVDDSFVSCYSGDGVIVATPTGSTAYSLSCGGPILTPDSGCFVITPIAAHSLSLRPIVVSDTSVIRLRPHVDGFHPAAMTLDSDWFLMETPGEVAVSKANVSLPLMRLNHQHFFNALHEKLAL